MFDRHSVIFILTEVLLLCVLVECSAHHQIFDLAPECDHNFDKFSECTYNAVQTGKCSLSNDTGYLNWCKECEFQYPEWIRCHCGLITSDRPECYEDCNIYFSCESLYAYDDKECKIERDIFLSCGSPTTKPDPLQSSMQPTISREFIFPYTLFPYSHVCSLVENADETLLAVFQAGSKEGAVDSTIYFSIKDPVTQEWSSPKIAVQLPNMCAMNPSVYQNSQGKIFLTFHFGGSQLNDGTCNTDNWTAAYVSSSDGGLTWSDIQQFPEGYLGSVKNKCIQIKDGKVLCPSSTEAFVNNYIEYWQSHIEITDDNFSTWKKSNFIHFNYDRYSGTFCPYYGNIQPTLVQLEDQNTILAFLRTGCSVIGLASSHDGMTYSDFATSTILPNPNSGIDSVMMRGQSDLGILIIFNNSNETRTPLSIASSTDGGSNWSILFDVETNLNITYQYPAIIQSKSNPRVAHTCYSYRGPDGNTIAYSKIEFPDQRLML